MQQMKAQQASFASMFGDEVDDDSMATLLEAMEMNVLVVIRKKRRFCLGHYCLSGGLKRSRRQTF